MDDHLLRFNGDKELVFIDCETEGLCLDWRHNLSWQVALIKSVDGKKIDEKNYYIKWDRDMKVGAEAARITRFDHKKYLEKALPIEEIFPTIEDWLDNADYIVGHNILGFDIYLIKGFYEYNGKSYEHLLPKIIDTNSLAKGVKLGLPYDPDEPFLEYQYRMMHKRKKGVRTNLKGLAKDYNLSFDENKLHDAIVDLELNLKVWNKLKWQAQV